MDNSCRPAHVHFDAQTGAGCQIDQRIETELLDTAVQQIVEPRLRDTQFPRSLRLRSRLPLGAARVSNPDFLDPRTCRREGFEVIRYDTR
jgi:hypothetical protein